MTTSFTRQCAAVVVVLCAAGLACTALAQAYRHDLRPDVDAYKASTVPAEILTRTNDFMLAGRDGSFGGVPTRHMKVLDEASDVINDMHADTLFVELDRMINNMTCIPGDNGGCARGN